MTRTVFLICTGQYAPYGKEGYPRVYYGNGLNRVDMSLFEELITQGISDIGQLENKLKDRGLRADPEMRISFLWEINQLVEVFFDENGKNPTFRILSPI